ncbi:MAG: prepilin-type N-terminal cleavage/methylation domain-containing protein [Cellulosilyticaceae bacterium]
MKASKGYTLMEMVVVLSVLSLVAGIGFGSFRYLELYRFNKFTDGVKDTVAMVQHQASLTNRAYQIRFKQNEVMQIWKDGVIEEEMSIPKHVKVGVKRMDGTVDYNGQVSFIADMSPAKAFTIKINQDNLGEVRSIAARVATGKITVYND